MTTKRIKETVAETFLELADYLESGKRVSSPLIGVAISESEVGEQAVLEGIRHANQKGFRAIAITGPDAHEKMEKMLCSGELDGAVTMHYPFPIGVSTIGRVVTPGFGKEMFLASTTGTASTDRITAMILNGISGIAAAKSCGIANPTVGIANLDGARQVEKALIQLNENGYPICFAASVRADGGAIMRGNDLLQGAADVMIVDTLTGNLLMKMFSSYLTGGNYESMGYGYGPGIGAHYEQPIFIISRASGAPVVAGAIEYASTMIENSFLEIVKNEYALANQAKLQDILASLKINHKGVASPKKSLEKEVVDVQIAGIEVMDLEDAVAALWEKEIYAESGMGCTGPIVLINQKREQEARTILLQTGFIHQS